MNLFTFYSFVGLYFGTVIAICLADSSDRRDSDVADAALVVASIVVWPLVMAAMLWAGVYVRFYT